MAIQVRRGNESDFDASKMLPGEWAVSLDTRYVRMCFAPGIVLRMSTYDAFEADMVQIQAILAECRSIQSAVQRIQTEVNSKASLTVEYANDAKESADRAYSEAERAKTYADNAEAVTGVRIATKDRAGLIKGGDNYIAEDGTLMLITETTSTTQPNSHAGREMVLEIGGMMEQETTAGNQLFDKNNLTTGNILDDGSFGTSTSWGYQLISVAPNESYTISGSNGNSDGYFAFYDESKNVVSVIGSTGNMTVTVPDNVAYLGVSVILSTDADTLMVNAGTTALPYEQYTGGQPAPNPSYPQEIKKSVVKGIRTHHKNFFGFGKTTTDVTEELRPNSAQRLDISAIDNEPNKIKCNFAGGNYSTGFIAIYGVDGTKDWSISYDVESNTTEYTPQLKKGKTNSNSERLVLQVGGGNGDTSVGKDQYFVLSDIMVSEENIPYEAYQGTEITFSQPIELYGKDGVQDVIGNGQIDRKFAKVVFDGSESWFKENNYFRYNSSAFKSNALAICDYFIYTNAYNTVNSTSGTFYVGSGNIRFNTSALFNDVAGFKAWLAENPVTVIYESVEETTEPLPLADQIALNSLPTYDGITYVEFIYDELEPTFRGKYGTSEVGGMTLESLLTARNNELKQELANERLSALEASVVNNI